MPICIFVRTKKVSIVGRITIYTVYYLHSSLLVNKIQTESTCDATVVFANLYV